MVGGDGFNPADVVELTSGHQFRTAGVDPSSQSPRPF
jgi:hypothetical protein